MDYQKMVNDLTGALGPTQPAYPNYVNAGNLDNNPFVDLSSQPLEYRSFVSHDGNIGYVPAYLFGRKSRNKRSKRKVSKRKVSKRKVSKRKVSKRKISKRKARKVKRRGSRFGCHTCGGNSFGAGCGCNTDESNSFGSPMCGAVCGM